MRRGGRSRRLSMGNTWGHQVNKSKTYHFCSLANQCRLKSFVFTLFFFPLFNFSSYLPRIFMRTKEGKKERKEGGKRQKKRRGWKKGMKKRWYRDRESGRGREDRREKEEEARGRNEERWKKGGRVGRRTGKGIKQAGERGTAGRFLLPSLSAAFELSLQRGTWQNDSQKTMFAFLHHTPYTSPTF